VQVVGELDIETTPQLEQTLSEPRAQLVVLDLRELAFMDSSGADAVDPVQALLRLPDEESSA
jgi:anti-anti-sigma factor